jgi:head-tail adaptor
MLQKRTRALAGLLRESVTLQQRTLDTNGDPLGPWADIFAAPARVLSKTSGETVLAQRVTGVQPIEITLRLDRFSALIDTDWRLIWLGWPFEITAIAPDEVQALLILMAVRSRAD